VIIDLAAFTAAERPYWTELEGYLDRLEQAGRLENVRDINRFHYLYQRASADLARIATFSAEPEIRRYLSALVERAYGQVHDTRSKPTPLAPKHWFLGTFPRTFRKNASAFRLALAITLIGALFGGLAISLDPDAKPAIMPWPHLLGDPADRVAEEEAGGPDRLDDGRARFSTYLMTHNTKVTVFAMALGMTFGLGTVILLFYNGVILGAVVVDYVMAGQATFLAGWLLPHGSVEIPAILIGGQAGLVLAGALIGWNQPLRMSQRLRKIGPDLITLMGGAAVFLVWAGVVESFLSQYHEPVLPYELKIALGSIELAAVVWFLARCGRTEVRS
jgi:uncharacterized membrane protein SpoIIM required for sporulation